MNGTMDHAVRPSLPGQQICAAFGQRLKSLRLLQERSQEELGFACGLHRTYISGVECGVRNISLINIHRIADALGLTPGAFFTDETPVEISHAG